MSEKVYKKFKEGLDSKEKLSLYRMFCKAVEFKEICMDQVIPGLG